MFVIVFTNGSFIASGDANVGELNLATVSGIYKLPDSFRYYKEGKFYDSEKNELTPITEFDKNIAYVNLSTIIPKRVTKGQAFKVSLPAGKYVIRRNNKTLKLIVSTGDLLNIRILEEGKYHIIAVNKLCNPALIFCESDIIEVF